MLWLFYTKWVTLVNSDNHVRPLTPDRKTIEKVSIFLFFTSNNSSIVGKLKPEIRLTNWRKKIKLAVLFSLNMLDVCAKTHIKQSQSPRQSPCNIPRPTFIEGVQNLGGGIMEVLKSVTSYAFNVIRDMMIAKNRLN